MMKAPPPPPKNGVTVTLNEAIAVLLRLSLAVKATVVVPTGKSEPEALSEVTVTCPSTASTAFGIAKLTVAPWALVAAVVMFAGTLLITGGVVS